MTSGGTPSDQAGVLALFVEESAEHVASLRSGLAGFRARPSPSDAAALLDGIRRNAHGIVGSAWAVGLHPVAQLMQAVEVSCVELVRAGAAPPPALLDAVAAAVDGAEVLVAAAVSGEQMPLSVDVEALSAALGAAVSD